MIAARYGIGHKCSLLALSGGNQSQGQGWFEEMLCTNAASISGHTEPQSSDQMASMSCNNKNIDHKEPEAIINIQISKSWCTILSNQKQVTN